MAEAAGVSSQPWRHELRPLAGETFAVIDPSGVPVQAIEFLGADATGRARFLHTGRAVPRSD